MFLTDVLKRIASIGIGDVARECWEDATRKEVDISWHLLYYKEIEFVLLLFRY